MVLTPEESGARLRWTPGRRIEVQYLEGPDLADEAGVWTWPAATPGQGRTRLVVIGGALAAICDCLAQGQHPIRRGIRRPIPAGG
jgi:hypothetical protein